MAYFDYIYDEQGYLYDPNGYIVDPVQPIIFQAVGYTFFCPVYYTEARREGECKQPTVQNSIRFVWPSRVQQKIIHWQFDGLSLERVQEYADFHTVVDGMQKTFTVVDNLKVANFTARLATPELSIIQKAKDVYTLNVSLLKA